MTHQTIAHSKLRTICTLCMSDQTVTRNTVIFYIYYTLGFIFIVLSSFYFVPKLVSRLENRHWSNAREKHAIVTIKLVKTEHDFHNANFIPRVTLASTPHDMADEIFNELKFTKSRGFLLRQLEHDVYNIIREIRAERLECNTDNISGTEHGGVAHYYIDRTTSIIYSYTIKKRYADDILYAR